MQFITIENLTHTLPIAIRVRKCASFFSRLRGLTFHKPLASGEGILMVFERESRFDTAIHMLFVRMDLAVVWINDRLEVADVCLARKWRPFYSSARPARYVLEISTAHLTDFRAGDVVKFNLL